MKRRQFSAALATSALGAASMIGPTRAQSGLPAEGKDYLRLSAPLPAPAAGKVEVIEFFWYGCPHCNTFEPMLEALGEEAARRRELSPRAGGLPRRTVRCPPADLLCARRDEADRDDASQGVRRDPRRSPAPGQAGRHCRLHDQERRRRRPSSSSTTTASRCRPRRARPARWRRPTSSTACRRWASRESSSLRRRCPARPSGRSPSWTT